MDVARYIYQLDLQIHRDDPTQRPEISFADVAAALVKDSYQDGESANGSYAGEGGKRTTRPWRDAVAAVSPESRLGRQV